MSAVTFVMASGSGMSGMTSGSSHFALGMLVAWLVATVVRHRRGGQGHVEGTANVLMPLTMTLAAVLR